LLADIEGKFGLEAEMLDELRGRRDFDDILYAPLAVKWAQGWLGYFWWEFYQDLKNRVTLRLCKHCGNVIAGGHADRQYCARDENVRCVQERNGIRQRKRRGKV
jgi:ribosomal protein S27AE